MSLNVERYRKRILAERTRLETDKANLRAEARTGESDGELTDLDQNHPADSSVQEVSKAMDVALIENLNEQLNQIRDALARIDAGTYGTCERCGKVIPEARLDALPYATLCIEDQEFVERSQ